MKNAYIAMVIAVWLLLPGQTKADELQDRLESAISAFGNIIPHAPDVGYGWADTVIRNAAAKASAADIRSDQIGDWVMRNQPSDADKNTMLQAEWLGATLKVVMEVNKEYPAAMPAQVLSAGDLRARMLAALDEATPGISRAEALAEMERAAKSAEEARLEQQAMREMQGRWGVPKIPEGTPLFGNTNVKVGIN